jgi:hypothetical protein
VLGSIGTGADKAKTLSLVSGAHVLREGAEFYAP